MLNLALPADILLERHENELLPHPLWQCLVHLPGHVLRVQALPVQDSTGTPHGKTTLGAQGGSYYLCR